MDAYKIIFSGPVGSGKSTAIASISNFSPVNTDVIATDKTAERKKFTTAAMDYGMLKLESGECIHLYGTPGQKRFDFMWDILTEGGIGLILLVDNKRPDPIEDMAFFLNAFRDFIDKTTVVIGITRMDISPTPTINDHKNWLKKKNLDIPIFETDGRKDKDILHLVETLLCKQQTGTGTVPALY